jgi:hypothetical protein
MGCPLTNYLVFNHVIVNRQEPFHGTYPVVHGLKLIGQRIQSLFHRAVIGRAPNSAAHPLVDSLMSLNGSLQFGTSLVASQGQQLGTMSDFKGIGGFGRALWSGARARSQHGRRHGHLEVHGHVDGLQGDCPDDGCPLHGTRRDVVYHHSRLRGDHIHLLGRQGDSCFSTATIFVE